jgi:hypothetical protein
MWVEGIKWEHSGFEVDQGETYELDDIAAMGFTVRKV